MRFEEAFSEVPTREEVVTYFLAVLELLKLGQMHIRQDNVYGEIELIWGRAKPREEEDLITAAKNGLRPPRTKRPKKAAEDPAAAEDSAAAPNGEKETGE